MAKLSYSTKALSDLERIGDFLAQQNASDALDILDFIVNEMKILSRHPLIGRKVNSTLKELVIPRGKTGYVALYSYEKMQDTVLIHSVRHQREAGFRP